MGRLEKEIKKQMKNDAEEFDAWYAKNQKQLYAFSEGNESLERSNGHGVIALSKRALYPVIACVGCIVICLTVLLTVFLTNGKNDIDLTFGDESVYSAVATEDELQTAVEAFPFISKMQITSQYAMLLREDNSLVFLIIDGELETENDFYFIKIQIEYNKHYEYGYKSLYNELINETSINDWRVCYEQGLNDINDLYVYYLLLEDKDGQNIYIEVHSFENDFDFILNEFVK